MTTTASATSGAPSVIVSQNGRKGDKGDDGVDGLGFNSVRKSLIDNPLVSLFRPNKVVDTLFGSLTSTRASAATYIDRYGQVKTAAIDELREESDGVLIEGLSTNELLHSEDFSNAVWEKIATASVTSNTSVAPDGTISADSVSLPAPSDQLWQQYVTTPNTNMTFSAWVKGVAGEIVVIRINDVAGINNEELYTLTGQWQRISVSQDFTGSTGTAVRGEFFNGFGATATDFEVWGAQLEEQPFATSYIPTTTAAATRAEDNVSAPVLNNFPDVLKSHSVYFKVKDIGDFTPDQKRLVSVKVASGIWTVYTSTANNNILFRAGDAVTFNTLTATPANINDFSVTTVYDAETSTLSFWVDGVFGQSKVISTYPTMDLSGILAFFALELLGTGSRANGNISDFRIYDRALNADEIKLLGGL